MKTIKKGTFNASYPINKLKKSLVNRDIVSNHSDLFAKKIEEYGWLSPVIIDKKGNIIEGHHRVLAAERMNLKSVPVYIVNWVNTKDLDEYQKYIISLNNNNRKWQPLDYLKSYSRNKKSYSYVFKKYEKYNEALSLGTILQAYFNHGSCLAFRSGESKIKDKAFSEYILDNLSKLRRDYGAKKIQAYSTRVIAKFLNDRVNGNLIEAQGIFKGVEELAEDNSPIISSIEFIDEWLRNELKTIRK